MTQIAASSSPGIRTFSIAPSRACPSVEPIPAEGVMHQGHHFTAAELAIVGAAIDAGVFYTSDLKEYCNGAWERAHPAVEHCLTRTGNQNFESMTGSDNGVRSARVKHLRETIQAAPRGTWGMLHYQWEGSDGHKGDSYTLFIADGQGGAKDVQTGPIVHAGRLPTYEDAIQSMVGYEIYLADRAEKDRREQARSRTIVRDAGLAAGNKLQNLRIGAKSYSSATVEGITEAGHVTLLLTKRGSRNRWRWTGLAQSIEAKSLPKAAPAYGMMVATEQ
jgi:hypothetical protein